MEDIFGITPTKTIGHLEDVAESCHPNTTPKTSLSKWLTFMLAEQD